MNKKQKMFREMEHIEKDFFDVDEETGIAGIDLHFASPDEVFDVNCISKIPIFNDDFDDWIRSAFEVIPSKYRIALKITFGRMEGYTNEQLKEIFRKNLLLSGKVINQKIRIRDRIAYGLIAAGLISFIAMMLIGHLWVSENFWHQVFFYILDIATTVLFWEAAGILLVESREHRVVMKSYRNRFASISFQLDDLQD